MKQLRLENLSRRMRETHRHTPLTLSEDGLIVRYSYKDMQPDDLSYWDDGGFVLNGRRFMVAWRHPRYVYKNAVTDLAWAQLEAEQGNGPDPDWLFEGRATNFKRVGKSGKRKKFSSHVYRQPSEERKAYIARLTEIEQQISQEGIDLDISPSWSWKRYPTSMGVSIVAPLEVRHERELAQLADLVRQLVKQQTTLQAQFPPGATGTVYGKADWLRELEWLRTRQQEGMQTQVQAHLQETST